MWTCPFPHTQILCPGILIAADMAGLRACIVPIHLLYRRSRLARLMCEDFNKVCKAIIGDFSSPPFLHPSQVQVLDAHKCVFPADGICQFEVKVLALIGGLLVEARQCKPRSPAMVRPLPLPRKLPSGSANRIRILLEKQGGFQVLAIGRREKLLESEVVADAFTCSCQDFILCRLTDKIKIDVPERIAFDRDGLDRPFNGTAFEIAVLLCSDLDGISFQELPPCLFQGIRFILFHLLKRGGSRAHPAVQIFEKELVGTVDSLCDVLHRLGADFLQIGESGQFFELRQMLLQGIDVQRFLIQAIIPFVQGNTVIVDASRRIDFPMKFPVSPGHIELEAIGSHRITRLCLYYSRQRTVLPANIHARIWPEARLYPHT